MCCAIDESQFLLEAVTPTSLAKPLHGRVALASEQPIRVAIVGGGCASIAAAFELTRPRLEQKYQVTIYQLGWRLGGKGASGRGPAHRIEEHGFHVWFGFYENAFRLVRECYAELNRDPKKCRIADWRDAFFPAPFIGFTERSRDGSYSNYASYFPPGEGLPGDPITQNNPFTVLAYLTHSADLLRMLLQNAQRTATGERPAFSDSEFMGKASAGVAEDLQWRIRRLINHASIATIAGLVEAVGLLQLTYELISAYPNRLIIDLLEAILRNARRQLEMLIEDDAEMLTLWQGIELVLVAMLGILRFGLISDPRGFDAINEYDFRDWMRINGASERTLQSPLVRTCYDTAFAYENGDYNRPSHGAGVGLRGSFRMLFGYRGAPFWKMRAGMGEVVFAPFYEVLKRRGVSFQFFHRLRNVRLAPSNRLERGESPYVEALEFDLQAKVKGKAEYQPLVSVDGLPCWPSRPDYSQLVDGVRLERERANFESHWNRKTVGTRTLEVVDDFDFVVLGVGLGAIPFVCKEFTQSNRRWQDMVARVKTVETQAFQIWMSEDVETLGWNHPPVSLCGFVQPFESWCDMSHLKREEKWLENRGSIAYFLSTLKTPRTVPSSDSGYPEARREEVRKSAIRFLNTDVAHLWPNAVRSTGEFRWELLRNPNGHCGQRALGDAKEVGPSEFDSQYWRANVDPSDRYVLSVPGSQKYRISPLDNTYDNFTIAGDWTACGLDSGCVEAAVMSGRLAAHAISSSPSLDEIIAYDHP